MLNEVNRRKLEKKLKELTNAQIIERVKFIERRKLDKKGDKNWDKYAQKSLYKFEKYLEDEYAQYRVMMIRAYKDDQQGKKPSPMINL